MRGVLGYHTTKITRQQFRNGLSIARRRRSLTGEFQDAAILPPFNEVDLDALGSDDRGSAPIGSARSDSIRMIVAFTIVRRQLRRIKYS